MKHPNLLHENAGIRNSNWGPPMSYAANLGRDEIIKMLYELGARDLESAIDRAALQSKIGTARMLHEMMGSPPSARRRARWTSLHAERVGHGAHARARREGSLINDGKRLAPVDVVLETDSRKPAAKHQDSRAVRAARTRACRTRQRWRFIAAASICSKNICVATRNCLQRTFTHEEIYPAGARLS